MLPSVVFAENSTVDDNNSSISDDSVVSYDDAQPELYEESSENESEVEDQVQDELETEAEVQEEIENDSVESSSEVESEVEDESNEVTPVAVPVLAENKPQKELRAKPLNEDNLKHFFEAKIRLLNLERSLTVQADFANKIVEKINDNDNQREFDLERLSQIATEFENLVSDLKFLIEEKTDIESKDELKVEFDTIKQKGLDLSKEFKSLVAEKLTQEEKAELREYLALRKDEIKESRKEKIETLKFEFKKRSIVKFLENKGIENSNELIADVDFSKITQKDLSEKIKSQLKERREEKVRDEEKRLPEEDLERGFNDGREIIKNIDLSEEQLIKLAKERNIPVEELKRYISKQRDMILEDAQVEVSGDRLDVEASTPNSVEEGYVEVNLTTGEIIR